jgi:hypothetical protein
MHVQARPPTVAVQDAVIISRLCLEAAMSRVLAGSALLLLLAAGCGAAPTTGRAPATGATSPRPSATSPAASPTPTTTAEAAGVPTLPVEPTTPPAPAPTTKKPAANPTTKKPAPAKTTPKSVYYANCTAAKAAGAAPLYRGEPGYRDALDRDKDGIACE